MRWVKIESSLLTQCTRLQGQLDMSRERLLSTLALLRSGVEFRSNSWRLETAGAVDTGAGKSSVELAKKLMDDVYELSGTLTKGKCVYSSRSFFSDFNNVQTLLLLPFRLFR